MALSKDTVKTDRLAILRRKLASREGTPGYEKNCAQIRRQIATIEKSPEPAEAEIEEAWEAAKAEREKSGQLDDQHEASAVASETSKGQSGD